MEISKAFQEGGGSERQLGFLIASAWTESASSEGVIMDEKLWIHE